VTYLGHRLKNFRGVSDDQSTIETDKPTEINNCYGALRENNLVIRAHITTKHSHSYNPSGKDYIATTDCSDSKTGSVQECSKNHGAIATYIGIFDVQTNWTKVNTLRPKCKQPAHVLIMQSVID
jgi:hypothetical protein